MINIQGLKEITDPNYRYKMHYPNLSSKKSLITCDNINVIAKELGRCPIEIIKYLKSKMAMNITYKDNVAIFPKKIDSVTLMNNLKNYIENNILCKKCNFPETIIENENKICKCCGNKEILGK